MADNKQNEQTVVNNVADLNGLEEVQEDKKPINTRIQKFLLLSAKRLEYTPKGQKRPAQAMSINLLDANECDPFTGQPKTNGFNPLVSIFCKEITPSIANLEKTQVFQPVYCKISGTENFTQLHGVLSDAELEMYRQIMAELL